MPDLSPQFTLFPRPKLPGSAPGMRGPERPPVHNDAMNPHGVHIRFGDWPENERSMNHAQGGYEEGVSVYDMEGPHALPVDPDPDHARGDYDIGWQREMHIDTHGDDHDFEPDYNEVRGNNTGEEMWNRRLTALRDATWGQKFEKHEDQAASRRGHFVRGTVVGFGHDDEPLLNNVKHVGEWPQHAHRFVAGTDGELFTRINDRVTKQPGWRKNF